jgi:hypothetical protein
LGQPIGLLHLFANFLGYGHRPKQSRIIF